MAREPESESYVTTDGQSASLSWNKPPIWGLRPDINYCLIITVLFLWGALSDERTGLSFVYATGPRQCSPSCVCGPLVSRPYFTVSHLRLPFSSPPTNRRVTVEVFHPASTQGVSWLPEDYLYSIRADHTENSGSIVETCLPSHSIATIAAIVACVTQLRAANNSYSIVACVFRLRFNIPAWGKYAITRIEAVEHATETDVELLTTDVGFLRKLATSTCLQL
jgi:hypothetical protein